MFYLKEDIRRVQKCLNSQSTDKDRKILQQAHTQQFHIDSCPSEFQQRVQLFEDFLNSIEIVDYYLDKTAQLQTSNRSSLN